MRLAGFTYAQIAKKVGISRQRVQQLLSPPKAIRDYVVRKYNGLCQDCGLIVGKSGHVHHQNGNSEDYNDIENLILLCISCHRKRHDFQNSFPKLKIQRDESLYQYHLAHPLIRQRPLAKIFHISQVRVSKILKRFKEQGG